MEHFVVIIVMTCILVDICCMIYIIKSFMSYMLLKMEQIIDIGLSEREKEHDLEVHSQE